MGIRFYCPNGHKLNVKEFQAGRLGICPFCGARSQIPTKSTRPSSKAARRHGVTAAVHATETDDPESGEGSDSSPDILPGEPPTLPGDPAGGKMLGPSRPVDTAARSGPVVAPPAGGRGTSPTGGRGTSTRPTATAAAGSQSAPAKQASPATKPEPQIRSAPVVVSPAASLRQEAGSGEPRQTIGPRQTTTTPAAPRTSATAVAPAQPAIAPASLAASEPPDPIAEAPDMIWYVRPPSGGQFGPASGDLMRTWLAEGRVSADSLVWREGWRDWQEAGSVFAKLRGNQIVDFLETTPVVPAAVPAAHAPRPKARRSSDRKELAVLIAVMIVVLILLAVFLWIWFHRQ
jgi:hypothetical protein